MFEAAPRSAGRQAAGACFSCTESYSPGSFGGEAILYEIKAPIARSLSMPKQVAVHNLCAFGFESDLLRRIKRKEAFSAAHLAAYRATETKALRDVARPTVRMA